MPTTGTLIGQAHLRRQRLRRRRDNKYTVTVTVTDDDGDSDVKTFEVIVLNVDPDLRPITATDVNALGETTVTMRFTDPGADDFVVWVDWGDKSGRAEDDYFVREKLSLTIGRPANVHASRTRTLVRRIRTTRGRHPDSRSGPRRRLRHAGVVEPGFSDVETDVISNPGEGNKFVRIDLTPQVPMLTFPVRPDGCGRQTGASRRRGERRRRDRRLGGRGAGSTRTVLRAADRRLRRE